MIIMTRENLAGIAENLKGARIEVSETGYSAEGLVSSVEVDDDHFDFCYIAGSTLTERNLSGAWSWGSVRSQGDTLRISVPMVGNAVVYMNTP